MKIRDLSKLGIRPAMPVIKKNYDGSKHYFCFRHGEEGRGRWEVRLPLGARDFPCAGEESPVPTDNTDYRLVSLKKEDKRGNPLYLLGKGEDDGKFLVFWWLSPGFRGSATYKIAGNAKKIACGEEAQGDAGRMGGADCPVVLVEGDCVLTWHREGRLYGEPADWIATFADGIWTICEETDCALESAVFEY